MLMSSLKPLGELEDAAEFVARHIDSIVPRSIARRHAMDVPPPASEAAALAELKALASKNQVLRSFIGQGYHGTHTPGVILRNILENPAWYTAYTPYQAEISQGRMEALVNFQTMVCDLTGMAIANASMPSAASGTRATPSWWPATATRRPSRSSRPARYRWACRWCWPIPKPNGTP